MKIRTTLVAVAWPLLTAGMCQSGGPSVPDAKLPVAISCVAPDTPSAPEVHTPEQLAKAPTGPDRYQMTQGDYLKLYGWMLQASPALEGCRAAGRDATAGT